VNNTEYISVSSDEEEGVIPESSSPHITWYDEWVKNERPAIDNNEVVPLLLWKKVQIRRCVVK